MKANYRPNEFVVLYAHTRGKKKTIFSKKIK